MSRSFNSVDYPVCNYLQVVCISFALKFCYRYLIRLMVLKNPPPSPTNAKECVLANCREECSVILLEACYQHVLTPLLSYRNEVVQLYF